MNTILRSQLVSHSLEDTITDIELDNLKSASARLSAAKAIASARLKLGPSTRHLVAHVEQLLHQKLTSGAELIDHTGPILVIAVNFTKIDLDSNLGVLSFGIHALDALRETDPMRLRLLVAPPNGIASHPMIRSFLEQGALLLRSGQRVDVELRLHHFQPRVTDTGRCITIVHDFHAFDIPWKYPNPHKIQSELLTHIYESDLVISHFPRTYSLLKSLVGDRARLTVCPTMLESNEENMALTGVVRFAIETSEVKKILYPAQFQSHKNHFNLLKAFRIVVDQYGPDVRLILTGSVHDSGYYQRVREAIDELNLQDYVQILGKVAMHELKLVYQRADVVIQASLAEGGAYIAQEALTYGKPVLIAKIPQAVAHLERLGGEWNYFDPLEPVDMANSLIASLRRPVSPPKVAAEKLLEWTWPAYGRQLQNFIAELCDAVPFIT